jgi:signal transduction histidine kinase
MSKAETEGQERLEKGLHTAGYQKTLKIFDLCFGLFSSFMAIISLITAIQGRSSWMTFIYLSGFVLANLILSQISNVFKNSIWLEIFRVYFVDGILTFFIFPGTNGPFQNYWPCYLVMLFAGGTVLTLWSRKRTLGYLQTVFWLCNYAAANFWMATLPTELPRFCMIAGVMAMSSILLIELVHMFNLSLVKENEMKAQLVQSSKMTALGEMAGGIAHEINNPLAIIKTISAQIAELAAESNVDTETLRSMAATNEKTVDRITKIVQGLRVFSRDGSKDRLLPVNVAHLIGNTVGLCQERFRNHGVNLAIDPIPAELYFEGRETQISQVILNLLQNAYDAIHDTKENWIRITVTERDLWIEIRVMDSGAGIPDKVREKLFEPFFTTKDVGLGTGLGLSVSQGIVRDHHGELGIDTECANTCFVLRLPGKNSKAG